MLANGATLAVATTSSATGTVLEGLKSTPDIGITKEWVENSCLASELKEYEPGVGDLGDLAFTFRYKNEAATDSYPTLCGYASADTKIYCTYTLKDGTKYTFPAYVSVSLGGGALNDAVEFTATFRLAGELTITNPTYTA